MQVSVLLLAMPNALSILELFAGQIGSSLRQFLTHSGVSAHGVTTSLSVVPPHRNFYCPAALLLQHHAEYRKLMFSNDANTHPSVKKASAHDSAAFTGKEGAQKLFWPVPGKQCVSRTPETPP